ncbi:MAG: hypothetical protein H6742_18240 [Alphaproteobacteria bacterium]|nr:hypothetical protein [Alphaproteobacteria bacterium]
MSFVLPMLLLACGPKPPPPPAVRLTPEVDGLRGELVAGGPASDRVIGGDAAALVLLYGGELRGELGPCGCDERPRGGLARIAAFRDAVVAAAGDSPVITVDGGGFLAFQPAVDGRPSSGQHRRNVLMGQAMAVLAPQAVNLSWSDVLALDTLPDDLEAPGLPLVSAHVSGPSAWPVEPYVVVSTPTMNVAITGITSRGPAWMSPQGWTFAEPVAAVEALELHTKAELVVLLTHGDVDAARTLAERGAVDVVIDTGDHRSFDAPFRVGEAIWVRSHAETLRIGELRLFVDEPGLPFVDRGFERKVDLDDAMPEDPALAGRARAAELELGRQERFR